MLNHGERNKSSACVESCPYQCFIRCFPLPLLGFWTRYATVSSLSFSCSRVINAGRCLLVVKPPLFQWVAISKKFFLTRDFVELMSDPLRWRFLRCFICCCCCCCCWRCSAHLEDSWRFLELIEDICDQKRHLLFYCFSFWIVDDRHSISRYALTFFFEFFFFLNFRFLSWCFIGCVCPEA